MTLRLFGLRSWKHGVSVYRKFCKEDNKGVMTMTGGCISRDQFEYVKFEVITRHLVEMSRCKSGCHRTDRGWKFGGINMQRCYLKLYTE